jgi:hypothetical protein
MCPAKNKGAYTMFRPTNKQIIIGEGVIGLARFYPIKKRILFQ